MRALVFWGSCSGALGHKNSNAACCVYCCTDYMYESYSSSLGSQDERNIAAAAQLQHNTTTGTTSAKSQQQKRQQHQQQHQQQQLQHNTAKSKLVPYWTISASLGSRYTGVAAIYTIDIYPAAQSSARQAELYLVGKRHTGKNGLPLKKKRGSSMVASFESERADHLELFRLVVFFALLSCCYRRRARTSTSLSSALSTTSSPAQSRASLACTRRPPNAWDHPRFSCTWPPLVTAVAREQWPGPFGWGLWGLQAFCSAEVA